MSVIQLDTVEDVGWKNHAIEAKLLLSLHNPQMVAFRRRPYSPFILLRLLDEKVLRGLSSHFSRCSKGSFQICSVALVGLFIYHLLSNEQQYSIREAATFYSSEPLSCLK